MKKFVVSKKLGGKVPREPMEVKGGGKTLFFPALRNTQVHNQNNKLVSKATENKSIIRVTVPERATTVDMDMKFKNGKWAGPLYNLYFRNVDGHTEKGNFVVCILCNDGKPIANTNTSKLNHLRQVGTGSGHVTEEETEMLLAESMNEKDSVLEHRETGKDEVLKTSHAILYRALRLEVNDDEDTVGCSLQFLASAWRVDVNNALWVCLDKRSLRTAFSDTFIAREKRLMRSGYNPSTKFRLEKAALSLYVAAKQTMHEELFRAIDKRRQNGQVMPFLGLSVDGWSNRRQEELLHVTISFVDEHESCKRKSPGAEPEPPQIVLRKFCIGAKPCPVDCVSRITANMIKEAVEETLEEMQPGLSSMLVGSTCDDGSNMRNAMNLLTSGADNICFAHTLDNAVQWSVGLKAKASKNSTGKNFLAMVKVFVKFLRKRKLQSALQKFCTDQRLDFCRVTPWNDTRWNGIFFTLIQLQAMSKPLDAFFTSSQWDNMRDSMTPKETDSALQAVSWWAQIKECLPRLIPLLNIPYQATQRLQGDGITLVDGFLVLLALRKELLEYTGFGPKSTFRNPSVAFGDGRIFKILGVLSKAKVVEFQRLSGLMEEKRNSRHRMKDDSERQRLQHNIREIKMSRDAIVNRFHKTAMKTQYMNLHCVISEYNVDAYACSSFSESPNEHPKRNSITHEGVFFSVAMKLAQQVDLRFFGGKVAQEEAFSGVHDSLLLENGNPHTSTLDKDIIMASILLDPSIALKFYETNAFEDLKLPFDKSFQKAKLFIEGILESIQNDTSDEQAEPASHSDVLDDHDDKVFQAGATVPRSEEVQTAPPVHSELDLYLMSLIAPASQIRALASELIVAEPASSLMRVAKFWRRQREVYPKLSQVAFSLLSVPATSAGVERQASTSGLIDIAKRNRLSKGMFEALSFIADNKELSEMVADQIEKDEKGSKLSNTTFKNVRKRGWSHFACTDDPNGANVIDVAEDDASVIDVDEEIQNKAHIEDEYEDVTSYLPAKPLVFKFQEVMDHFFPSDDDKGSSDEESD